MSRFTLEMLSMFVKALRYHDTGDAGAIQQEIQESVRHIKRIIREERDEFVKTNVVCIVLFSLYSCTGST